VNDVVNAITGKIAGKGTAGIANLRLICIRRVPLITVTVAERATRKFSNMFMNWGTCV